MLKKYLLSFLAVILLSLNAFSQTPIWNESDFRNMSAGGNYIQMTDITFTGTINASVISSFSGTYDGNGYSITYQATMTTSSNNNNYALFGRVTGTIKNLKIENSSITLTGSGEGNNAALLCGTLGSDGFIEYCSITNGEVKQNTSGIGGGGNAGLFVGTCEGTLRYCSASGSTVLGYGYAGGLVGKLNGTILGCSFTNGSVTAQTPSNAWVGRSSYAGGICGCANRNSSITSCYVNDASIEAGTKAAGITCSGSTLGGNNPNVENNYCNGTVKVNGSVQQLKATSGTSNDNANNSDNTVGGDVVLNGNNGINNGIPNDANVGYENNGGVGLVVKPKDFVAVQTGNFNESATWQDNNMPQGDFANIKISQGCTVTINSSLLLKSNYKIESNQGVLRIAQGGEIVNTTTTNVGGTIEIVSQSANEGNWNFFGAPFTDYKLEVIKPHETSDVAVCKYNYADCAWVENDWATPETPMSAGEGAFAYHFYTGAMTFENLNCSLNNSDVTFTRNLGTFEGGHWMALANPYPAKLSVSKFLQNQTNVQGQGVYVWNGTTFAFKSSGDINVSQGFFVNYNSEGSQTATFNKSQFAYFNQSSSAKTEVAPREFIELALEKGDESVKVYFAQNEEAEQEYDIYDANKMFATMGAAEPYFVTDGIALIKEEVKTLPYYATMNVRSEDNAEMNFVLNNLPDGYAVSIIDGENVIDMAEGSVYSTQIASGDNENRFKLLVKQAVGLAEVEELDVRITNSDRHIAVQTAEKNIAIEVYNTLGQKVYETKEHNFILKGVSAGVYMIKAYNQSGSKTAKIVVK